MSGPECPTCGKSDFSDEQYMKRHHTLVHDESLREEYECSLDGCNNRTHNPRFCSTECFGKAKRKHEKSECRREGCNELVYKHEYCSHNCANKETWKRRDNPAKRPEVRQKLSEMRQGERNPFHGETHTEESLQKISESSSGENNHLYGVTGEDHPSHGIVSGLKRQTVAETGHVVRSNWERDIDLLLHGSQVEYEYEPKTFMLVDEKTYTPDFVVDNGTVIEVKGWPDDLSERRARHFMEQYPERKYVVVGNRIPCDTFVPWDNRQTLLDKLD